VTAPAGAQGPIRIASGGRALSAWIDRPRGVPRGSVAIAHPHPAHGGHMDHSVVRAAADRAVHAGLVALRFDFGGVRESEGDVRDVAGHLVDLAAASAAAAGAAPAGAPRFGAGYSYGARSWVRAVVEGSVGSGGGASVRGLLLLAPPSRVPKTPRDFGDLLLGRPVRDATLDETALARLAALRVPARIVVGERDVVAPPDELAAHRGPATEIAVLPALNHFFCREVGAGAPDLATLVPALDAAWGDLSGQPTKA
jgi:alpha/beta superfamily hydrolase